MFIRNRETFRNESDIKIRLTRKRVPSVKSKKRERKKERCWEIRNEKPFSNI